MRQLLDYGGIFFLAPTAVSVPSQPVPLAVAILIVIVIAILIISVTAMAVVNIIVKAVVIDKHLRDSLGLLG